MAKFKISQKEAEELQAAAGEIDFDGHSRGMSGPETTVPSTSRDKSMKVRLCVGSSTIVPWLNFEVMHCVPLDETKAAAAKRAEEAAENAMNAAKKKLEEEQMKVEEARKKAEEFAEED